MASRIRKTLVERAAKIDSDLSQGKEGSATWKEKIQKKLYRGNTLSDLILSKAKSAELKSGDYPQRGFAKRHFRTVPIEEKI